VKEGGTRINSEEARKVSKGKWAMVVAVALFACVTTATGMVVHWAWADGGVGGPTAAVMGNTWSVIAGPVTKGGDVVGYNVYVFQEKTGMLWAWECGAERELLRIPTREQRGIFDSGPPRGAVR
jgi:hypothetical protein